MVTHLVIFTWVDGVTDAQRAEFACAMAKLVSDVGDMGEFRHGPDLHFREGNGDYALLATFADQAGWDGYQADPRHKAFVRDVVAPIQASRVAIQLDLEAAA